MARRFGSLLLLAVLVGLWWVLERGEVRRDPPARETIRAANGAAVRVIDGDSLRIGGREIRLAGIDAPELHQQCARADGRSWPCGEEARAALRRLVAAPGLTCTPRATDRYGRALSLCRTEAGDVGQALAGQGLALGAGDRRFDEPTAAMKAAKAARRGVWQGKHQHPAEWRKAHPRGAG